VTIVAGQVVMAKVIEKPPELWAHVSGFGPDDERAHVREYALLNQTLLMQARSCEYGAEYRKL